MTQAETTRERPSAHIVIVDDEAALREGIARYLRGLGHEVTTAADGHEAMAALGAARIDLIITDIHMPEMDGIEIIDALRDRSGMVPVIAMSGGGRIDKHALLDSAKLLGAASTLEKPFDLEALR
jgi:two-component system response regulator MprA